ncbi:MAG: NADPH-dependent FMN reductase [Solirubrobacterales bacterium]
MKILGISGSLRGDSFNSLLLGQARQALPADASFEEWLGLRELPHYDQDIDAAGEGGPAVEQLRRAISEADAILFVTPEYNGSIPGVLKNAVDWASRPKGEAALQGKPVAAISASTGQYGGVWAQADLRRVLGIAGARVVDMEFSVPKADLAVAAGALLDDEQWEELGAVLEELTDQARISAAIAAQRLAA